MFPFFMLSKGAPSSLKIINGDSVTFRPNENLTLTCEALNSKPAANISWYIKLKDGREYVKIGNLVKIYQNFTL